jgi:hypothetical protein
LDHGGPVVAVLEQTGDFPMRFPFKSHVLKQTKHFRVVPEKLPKQERIRSDGRSVGPGDVPGSNERGKVVMKLRTPVTQLASAFREFVAPRYRPELYYMRGPGPACARRARSRGGAAGSIR